MQTQQIGSSSLQSSRLVYGCMRICGDNSDAAREKGKAAIRAAVDAGYNHFDHADIYAGGKSEELFAEVLKEDAGLREKIIITSKLCSIISVLEHWCSTCLRGQFILHMTLAYFSYKSALLQSCEV